MKNLRIRMSIACCASSLISLFGISPQSTCGDEKTISCVKHQLSAEFFAEGASVGDINQDGVGDVVAGPYWFAGPDFELQSPIYPPHAFAVDSYSDNFLSFCHDINGDDWPDVLVAGHPGLPAYWYENPRGGDELWKRHLVHDDAGGEAPTLADVTGDGRPEFISISAGKLGYAEIPADDPTAPWTFRPITPDLKLHRYTHGMGVGDLNGDGRTDLIEKSGWWEQPESETDTHWIRHEFEFSAQGGAQMLVTDVDGDGDNDVITSLQAHGHGLAWFENKQVHSDIVFEKHLIMGDDPSTSPCGIAFTQLHALALADMDGDGLQDVVTGKRYWAHNGHDVGAREPAVLYWFRLIRNKGKVDFAPQPIDQNSGVGTQVTAQDVTGDDIPDIVVGNKKGIFVHTTRRLAGGTLDRQKTTQTPLRPTSDNPYPHAGLSAADAAAAMVVPPKFQVTPCASEPDIQQPIAMTIDDQGRLWVAEAYAYPRRAPRRGRKRPHSHLYRS